MAWTARTAQTAGNSSGGNLTLTKPTGTVDGDLLIVVLYSEYSSTAWTLPSGWAWYGGATGQAIRSGGAWVFMAWKRASGDGANYTFTHGGTAWRAGTIMAWAGGLESGDPKDAGATGRTSSSSEWDAVLTGITTVTNGCLLVGVAGDYNGYTLDAGSSGMTLAGQIGGTGIVYQVQTTAGATGNKTLNYSSNSDQWATWFVALKPASGGGSVSVTPAAATAKASRVDPTVVLASLALTPSARTMKGASVNPSAVLGSLALSPAARTMKAVKSDPSVMLGALSLSPGAAVLKGASIAPAVALGSLLLSPTAVQLKGSSVAPTVVLGALSITPGAVTFKGLTIAPTVISGGNIVIIPGVASMRAAGVDPAVVLGALSLIPGVVTLKGASLGPGVQLSSVSVTPAAIAAKVGSLNPVVVLSALLLQPGQAGARALAVGPAVLLGSILLHPAALSMRGRVVQPTVIGGEIAEAFGLAYLSVRLVETAEMTDAAPWSAVMNDAARETAALEDEPL